MTPRRARLWHLPRLARILWAANPRQSRRARFDDLRVLARLVLRGQITHVPGRFGPRGFLARDGARFVATVGQWRTSAQILPRPVRLTGLDPAARYRVTLQNPEDAAKQSRGPNALKAGPRVLSGQALMGQGLRMPATWPGTLWVLEGERV